MDTCLDLIALQYTCMIVMAMLAFFVFVSRYYVTCRNRQFEQSRWMIVVALLLFVVHYMCQMRLGWRQQGNDVGVLFNLLFYSPSAILLSWSQLNILRAGHRRWSFMRYGVVGYALMVLCIVAGVISNGSLHIGPMLYVADAIHFFTLLYWSLSFWYWLNFFSVSIESMLMVTLILVLPMASQAGRKKSCSCFRMNAIT